MATGWIGFKVHFVSYPFWSTLFELSAMLLTKPYQWRSALTKSVARKLVKGAHFIPFFIICRLLDKECAILHETPFPDFINSFLCAWKSDACFPAAKSSKKKKGNKGKSDPVVQPWRNMQLLIALLKRRRYLWMNVSALHHGPLARYVKLRVSHAQRMPGTFSAVFPATDFKGNR